MSVIRLYNLAVSLDDDFDRALRREAAKRLGVDASSVRLVKRGVDARERTPRYNCTVDVELPESADLQRLLRDLGSNAGVPEPTPPLTAQPGNAPLRGRVVVVGSGPAGGFAAYVLALNGFKPLLIERGKPALERLRQIGRWNAGVVELDPESNALFGEGGAGSFSDGKLYTSNKRDPYIPQILNTFVECGAPEQVLTDASPHVGTDVLSRVVVTLREKIQRSGGEFRFDAKLTDLRIEDGRVTGITINDSEHVDTSSVILAPGHSARDTYEMLLARGVGMEAKPFQLGVRIEHPQTLIDKAQLARYARDKRLTPASYDVACHAGKFDLFSFCMCPGGITMAAVNEPGCLNTNGMSFSPRASGYANSALVTTFGSSDFGTRALDGVEFQRRLERAAFEAGGGDYSAPAQPVTHYLRGLSSPRNMRGTYARGRKYAALEALLPEKLNKALRANLPEFDKRIRGFLTDAAILHAIEARASSPVRIPRNPETRESTNVEGLYPAGEGAGYAGGIISAALDGIHSAFAIVGKYART
ncbi:MAG: NAD(P)/FAD-dependent oxidoreductase [Planctomycetes bacterium]|nr:NAD(P)/FAD-dependent oxidoreductase [Planctomycetota bacterium]